MAKSTTKGTHEDKDRYDFLVDGHRSKADEFKTKATMKFSEWMEEQKIN